MVNVAVTGCGYWGPNRIRNFSQIGKSSLKAVCDLDEAKLKKVRGAYPGVETVKDYRKVLEDNSIDAVAIATYPSTHFNLAKEALEKGKHVFVEKPLTLKSNHAKQLVDLAEKKGLVLMVGHTFEYNPAVNKLKQIIDKGELGEIYYMYSRRLNLGLYQRDTNVIWDLAPHDISIMFYLLGKEAESVQATADCNVKDSVADVAFINMNMEGGASCHLHVSWLDPLKVREAVIVGNKKMALFNDLEPLEKIKVYDKGVTVPSNYREFGEFQLSYNYGDVVIPRIENAEPLNTELSHFIECIEKGKTPRSDGKDGLKVVRAMEAAEESARQHGKEVKV